MFENYLFLIPKLFFQSTFYSGTTVFGAFDPIGAIAGKFLILKFIFLISFPFSYCGILSMLTANQT